MLKTNKITVVGDPHAQSSNLGKIKRVFDYIEDLNNDCVILGDLFHTKVLVRSDAFNYVCLRLSSSKVKYTILVGNHDYHNNECQEHSLEPLKLIPNVTVIDSSVVLDDIGFLPYIHDVDTFRQELSKLKVNTLFCHADIKGFDYGNGHISTSGLDMSDLAKFPQVISGHYHKFANKGNITYLGTPFSHSFGESNQLKYIGVYDRMSKNLELYETDIGRHITEIVNCDNPKSLTLLPGNYYRIILTGSESAVASFDKSKYPEVKFIEKPDGAVKIDSIDESRDNLSLFNDWAINCKKYPPDIVGLGLDVLKSVE